MGIRIFHGREMLGWIKNKLRGPPASPSDLDLRCRQLREEGKNLLAKCDFVAAEHCFRQAIEADGTDAPARVSLGLALQQQQLDKEALAELKAALALDAANPDCHYLIGRSAQACSDWLTATHHYQRACELNPKFAMAFRDACALLIFLGRFSDAAKVVAAGLATNPGFAELHFFEGNIHLATQSYDWALESYEQALELGFDHGALHGFIGGIALKKNLLGKARTHLERAIELSPGNAEAHHDLGIVFSHLGQIDQAIQQQQAALALKPDWLDAHSSLLFGLCFSSACAPAAYLAQASRYAQQVRRKVTALPRNVAPGTHASAQRRALRVGWVSGDLRQHVNMAFFKEVLKHLAAEPLTNIAFSNNPFDDNLTGKLRSMMDEWHNIADLGDPDVAALIQARQVDILVDLSGHTAHNRLAVFAWRAAPVQVSWLGFSATTGLAEIDYLLADELSVPREWHDHFSERIWYLPHTRLCLAAPGDPQDWPVRALPAERAGFVTFGCFQTLGKINDRVLKAWAEVMASVQNSRMRLQVRNLEQAGVRENLLHRLSLAGIEARRVSLHEGTTANEYLAAHNEVDLILDTFPYPGGTTTAQALWMGVPTITLLGDSMLARQGASMLNCVGLPDWIAVSEADYAARAVRLALDVPALAELRLRLRRQATQSPLFDSPGFARNLSLALQAMHWGEPGVTGS
jgi:predicted O-linked N-acetylglucosamine transferase (SPINDLY family)